MNNRFFNFRAACVLAVILTGCTRGLLTMDETQNGNQIRFGASTAFSNSLLTRTEYSGQLYGTEPAFERIDWTPQTDIIRVVCDAASWAPLENGPSNKRVASDYVFKGDATSSSQYSRASVEPRTGNGLQWGTGMHYFFALYPAPGTKSNYDSSKVVPESEASIEVNGEDAATITGVVKADQDYVKVSTYVKDGTTFKEFKPNMNYAYMYAFAKANREAGKTPSMITLDFKPLVTTFEFTLKAADTEAASFKVVSFELRSEEDAEVGSKLSGEFTASIDADGNYVVSVDETGKSVKMSFNEADRPTLSKTDAIKLMLFALPVDQKGLTIDLTLDKDGTTLHRTLPLKADLNQDGAIGDDEWITINAAKKVYFTNMGVPGVVYTYTLDDIDDIVLASKELLYGKESDVDVKSYRTHNVTGTVEGVAWKAYAQSSDGTYVDHDSSDWPDWLSLSAYEGNGDPDGEDVKVLVQPNELVGTKIAEKDSDDMMDILQGTTPVGSDDAPRDLSLYDIYGSAYINGTNAVSSIMKAGVHSANCYVVSAPGYYCLPLVYGNAIDMDKGGADGNNPSAYSKHTNSSGNLVTSPFILSDVSTTGPLDAVVLWQDVLYGSEILLDEDISVIDAPSGAGLPDCKYIKFRIRSNRILPGNIVIALRDTGNGNRILWSWHIWVTTVPHSGNSDYFSIRQVAYRLKSGGTANASILNCNLGWTPVMRFNDGKTIPRETVVKIVPQAGDATPVTFLVKQPELSLSYNGEMYSNTFYQWGRKDPFLPTKGQSNTNRIMTSSAYPENMTAFNLSTAHNQHRNLSLAEMIREPHVFYNSATNKMAPYLWSSDYTSAYGGYSASESNAPATVKKTIYDPSPAGFSVPSARIYTGFTTDGGNKVYANQSLWCGALFASTSSLPRGMRFTYNATQNTSSYTLYFYATGYRSGNTVGLVNDNGRSYMSALSTNYGNGYPWFFDFAGTNSSDHPDLPTINPFSWGSDLFSAYSIRPALE